MALDNVIFLDLETTGLADTDEIIEIGAIKIQGGREEVYWRLVKPSVSSISPRIFELCSGLSEEDLKSSPPIKEIQEEFLRFIGDLPLVCHNAAFEKRMLEKGLGQKLQNPLLDTLELFCLFKPHFPRHNLQYLLQHYLREDRPEAHRALEDARDTMELVKKLFQDLAGEDYDLLEETLQIMRPTGWSWLPYLQKIAPKSLRQVKALLEDSEVHKVEPSCAYTLKDLESLLKNEKIWREHFPLYTHRPQQLQIALSAADSFKEKKAVFIEAPTGSGKTLAYLLAALIFAVRERKKVFISTNTKNLQEQILSEIPRIAAVLGIENLCIAKIKGISNYACRRRIEEELESAGADLDEALSRIYLANWAKRTASGELEEEASYWLRRRSTALFRLMNGVRCRREDCDGRECKYYRECFYQQKLRALQKAQLCIINHSLLLTWPSGYPEIKCLLIDEAHTLEENAFEAFSRELSSSEINQFMERMLSKRGKGLLHFLSFFARRHLQAPDITPLINTAERVVQHVSVIGQILEGCLEKKQYRVRLEIPRENKDLKEAVLNLSSALESLAYKMEEVLKKLSSLDEDFKNTSLFYRTEESGSLLRSWAAFLQECFSSVDQEDGDKSCRFLECSAGSWSFRISPVDVSALFYYKVISSCDSLLLTSATLAERSGYRRVAEALGFDRLEQGRVVFVDPLPNVYDYGENSVLAIPSDSPGYNDEAFVDYMAQAVISTAKILGGRTLALFTSLERLQQVMKKVKVPLEKEGISVLGGENSSKRSDLEYFREDKNAVLFGSRGFFEGVDISGPALSCIIIDKLSFPFQHDPLLKARARYLVKQGLDPFNELLLYEVKRTLRQQFGRLIRSESDRGFVLVLDQLGTGKRYCQDIIKELPAPQILRNVTLEEIINLMKEKFRGWGYKIFERGEGCLDVQQGNSPGGPGVRKDRGAG